MFNILITFVFVIMSINWNAINSENFNNINEYRSNLYNNNNISIENNNKINLSNIDDTNKDNMKKFMNNNIYNNNNNNGNNEGSERILSRRRRYLIFPEGSSFQVVWDGIVPIVDYNNYLILGITVALAWELPSKPPSEQLEDIREKLNNGTLGLQRNDTIDNIKYIDTNNNNNIKNSPSTLMMMTNSKLDNNYKFHPPLTYYNNNNNNNDDNYYYNNNHNNKYVSSFNTNSNQRYPMYYNKYINESNNLRKSNHYNKYHRNKNYSNWNKLNNNPWTKFTNRIKNAWRRNGQSTTNKNYRKNNNNEYHRYPKNNKRKHRIYPVFGKRKKRSTEPVNFTQIERKDLRHHRSSRHSLYEKIEKFLKAKNQNGFECVLKALCETGQREDDEEPTTFLGEIMRAIFTMPQSIDPVTHHKHKAYDEAHAHDGDCNEKYPLCDGSIWAPDFII